MSNEPGDWEKYVAPWKDPSPDPIFVKKIEAGIEADMAKSLTIEKLKKAMQIMLEKDMKWVPLKPTGTPASIFWDKIGGGK